MDLKNEGESVFVFDTRVCQTCPRLLSLTGMSGKVYHYCVVDKSRTLLNSHATGKDLDVPYDCDRIMEYTVLKGDEK